MKQPQKGFYYHYKHDPTLGFNNYAYEVIGLARHSEDKTNLVMYRPLYESDYLGEAECSVRPLDMFMENVTVDGKTVPRFTKIEDSELISKLNAIKNMMYGSA